MNAQRMYMFKIMYIFYPTYIYIRKHLLRNLQGKEKTVNKHKEGIMFSPHIPVDCVVCHVGSVRDLLSVCRPVFDSFNLYIKISFHMKNCGKKNFL